MSLMNQLAKELEEAINNDSTLVAAGKVSKCFMGW